MDAVRGGGTRWISKTLGPLIYNRKLSLFRPRPPSLPEPIRRAMVAGWFESCRAGIARTEDARLFAAH